jgi:hypothetical protein
MLEDIARANSSTPSTNKAAHGTSDIGCTEYRTSKGSKTTHDTAINTRTRDKPAIVAKPAVAATQMLVNIKCTASTVADGLNPNHKPTASKHT